jgi:hypothetical protein
VLTAAWVTLVLVALGRSLAGRWFTVLGGTAAALIFIGVFSPLEVSAIDLGNFAGYVLFSVWMIAFAVLILRRRRAS